MQKINMGLKKTRSGKGIYGKKGMSSEQVSWVFMLVAGVVILMFFFVVVQKQKGLSREATAEKVLTNLQGLFTGASVSTGSINYFETPEMKFQFTCDPDTCTQYGCGDSFFSMPDYSGMRRTLSSQPLFSARDLKGTGMTVITKPWNVPYRTTNFVYITNPSVAYVVVYPAGASNQRKAQEILDMLPDEVVVQQGKETRLVVKKKLSSTEISNDKTVLTGITQERVKIIAVDYKVNLLDNIVARMESQKISAISVSSSSYFGGTGTVKFYKFYGNHFKQEGEDMPYIGLPSFLGAVFAEDRDNYECNMMKAFASYTQVTKVYEARRTVLENAAKERNDDACFATYEGAATPLDTLINVRRDAKKNMVELTTRNAESIYKYGMEEKEQQSLEEYNQKLERQSCPLIY